MIAFPNHIRNNRLLQIIYDNWQEFKKIYPAYDDEYYEEVVMSVLRCSNPRFGFRQYMCLHCGEGSKVVAFSCKSRFCLRCGRVSGEKFSLKIKERLHPDIAYRHLILTTPEQLRLVFYQSRMDPRLFRLFFEYAWKCVQDTVSEALGFEIECGCLSVLHLVGRSGEYKPHIHILMMAGGINPKTGRWHELNKFSYKILHMAWQRRLLEMIEAWDESGSYKELVRLWWDKDPFCCPKCGEVMELVRIWNPFKCFVYSLFKHLFGKDIGPPGDLPDILFTDVEYGSNILYSY